MSLRPTQLEEQPDETIEAALAALRTAVKEGTLSDAYRAELAEILGAERPRVAEVFEADDDEPVPEAPAIVIVGPEEVKRLVKSLGIEEDYVSVLKAQRDFQLLRIGQRPPSLRQVLETFTPEMLVAARDFQEPRRLVLTTKGRSFNDLVAAMNDNRTIRGQQNAHVDALFRGEHATRISGHWSAHITEAPTEMDVHTFDNVDLILGERLERFDGHKSAVRVRGMNRWIYAHLMMLALREGKPIDAKFWTLLDEDPALSDDHVPCAGWDPFDPENLRVNFVGDSPENGDLKSRIRRSVGGFVPGT